MYMKILEDYTTVELQQELDRRRTAAEQNRCWYCKAPLATHTCKHSDTPAAPTPEATGPTQDQIQQIGFVPHPFGRRQLETMYMRKSDHDERQLLVTFYHDPAKVPRWEITKPADNGISSPTALPLDGFPGISDLLWALRNEGFISEGKCDEYRRIFNLPVE